MTLVPPTPPIGAPGPGYWEDTKTILDRLRDKVFDVRGDNAVLDEVANDSPHVQDTIHRAEDADGGVVLVPGFAKLNTPLLCEAPNVVVVGIGRGTGLSAGDEMPELIRFSAPGARSAGWGVEKMTLKGGGLGVPSGVFCDSVAGASFKHLYASGMERILDITSDQLGSTEGVSIEDLDMRAGAGYFPQQIFRSRAGSAGAVSDNWARGLIGIGLEDWGVELDDSLRWRLEDVAAAAAVGVSGFEGGVLIKNSNTAPGSPSESGQHIIDGVYCEAVSVATTARAVKILAPVGATKFNRANIVRGACNNGAGTKLFECENASATTGRVRENQFENPRLLASGVAAGSVIVGAGCTETHLRIPHSQNFIDAMVSDSGSLTRINGVFRKAYGVGITPTASETDVGLITHNTSDDTLWITTPDGVVRSLA